MKGTKEGACWGPEQGKASYPIPFSLLGQDVIDVFVYSALPTVGGGGCWAEGYPWSHWWQNWSKLSKHSPSTVPLPAILQGGGRAVLKAKVIPASRLLSSCFPPPLAG